MPVVDVAKNELLLVATHNNTFPMVLSAPLGSNGCEVSVNQNQKSDYLHACRRILACAAAHGSVHAGGEAASLKKTNYQGDGRLTATADPAHSKRR